MQINNTNISELVVIEPRIFEDDRGYFFEAFNDNTWPEHIVKTSFVQDNEAFSQRGVLRGLHYQIPPYGQAKLVRVIQGEVIDVAVDIRPGSPTYGHHHTELLSGENKKQMYVPRGFAHGYVVLSDTAIFAYKCDNYYSKAHEGGIIFDDATLQIDWGIDTSIISLSDKDVVLPVFGQHRPYALQSS